MWLVFGAYSTGWLASAGEGGTAQQSDAHIGIRFADMRGQEESLWLVLVVYAC
jgi:hypothetical protein